MELCPVLFSCPKWLLEHSRAINVCADTKGQKVLSVCEETIKTVSVLPGEKACRCRSQARKCNERAEKCPLAQGSSVSENPSLPDIFRSLIQTFSSLWTCFLRVGSHQGEPWTFRPLEYPSWPVMDKCFWFCGLLVWQTGKYTPASIPDLEFNLNLKKKKRQLGSRWVWRESEWSSRNTFIRSLEGSACFRDRETNIFMFQKQTSCFQ